MLGCPDPAKREREPYTDEAVRANEDRLSHRLEAPSGAKEVSSVRKRWANVSSNE